MKGPAVLLAAALMILSAAVVAYRVVFLKYPLFQPPKEKVWELSFNARVIGSGDNDVRVMIGLPKNQPGLAVLGEEITSGTLSFSVSPEGSNRFGIWSGKVDPGGTLIAYRTTLFMRTGSLPQAPPPPLESSPGNAESPHRPGGAPQYAVEGLLLADSLTSNPIRWLESWTGGRWEAAQPETGEVYPQSASLLPLTTGGVHAVRVFEGEVSETRWALSQQVMSQWHLYSERVGQSDTFLDRWSLLRLPDEFQRTFRILLLVPIGALAISVLRTVVGFPTFGIFMPVLMALAFRVTGLYYGLGIFAGVILIGFGIRHFIDKLHLLLVPRLSVILTLVIACFTLFALIGNKLGLRQLMAVGLLPFVILTMTIERFFIIVEEKGIREAVKTAAGSAAVAAITYQLINFEPLQITFFVYPELLLSVAALQVLVGRYTGYRLSEIMRFGKFRRPL